MKKDFLVVGLMSGTSLDGLDLAACRFIPNEAGWGFEILAAESISYSDSLREQLKRSVELSGLDLSLLDISLGRFFGEKVRDFCGHYKLVPDFIGSHGHTVFHQPEKQLTLQIGNPEAIGHFSGFPVVANFRLADVLAGGQGAPLVPFGEHYLFPDYSFFLNLGGISNVGMHKGQEMSGFDVSACNMGLNYLAGKKGLAYDMNGNIARSGALDEKLFNSLNGLDYFRVKGPKSLGFEWFESSVVPILEASPASLENKLCTFVHHIAFQVNQSIRVVAGGPAKVLATGGGALNSFLVEQLNVYGGGELVYEVPDKTIVEFKEALVFAFLALQRALGKTNISSRVTGSARDHSAGSMHGPFWVTH